MCACVCVCARASKRGNVLEMSVRVVTTDRRNLRPDHAAVRLATARHTRDTPSTDRSWTTCSKISTFASIPRRSKAMRIYGAHRGDEYSCAGDAHRTAWSTQPWCTHTFLRVAATRQFRRMGMVWG